MFPLQAWAGKIDTVTTQNQTLGLKQSKRFKKEQCKENQRGYSQIGGLPLLDFFALAAGGCFFAAQGARDAHEQAAVTQEEAADVHQHEEQQQRSQAEAHHRPQPQPAEQGFC